ncbi:hypothetical protein [Mesotoga prima]|uniref:hypothetical protein n=1 Tax=Mesotoga prima TaxID=1184387 RepID=UPI002FD8A39B
MRTKAKLYLTPILPQNLPEWVGQKVFITSRDEEQPLVTLLSCTNRIAKVQLGKEEWDIHYKEQSKIFRMVAFLVEDEYEGFRWVEIYPDEFEKLEKYLVRASPTVYAVGMLDYKLRIPFPNQDIINIEIGLDDYGRQAS